MNFFLRSFLVTNPIFNGYRVIQIVYFIVLEFCSFGFQKTDLLLSKIVAQSCSQCSLIILLMTAGSVVSFLILQCSVSPSFNFYQSFQSLTMILIFCVKDPRCFRKILSLKKCQASVKSRKWIEIFEEMKTAQVYI